MTRHQEDLINICTVIACEKKNTKMWNINAFKSLIGIDLGDYWVFNNNELIFSFVLHLSQGLLCSEQMS